MLASKELLGQFKAAAWKRPDEVEAFVAAAEAPQAADLWKLVEVVAARPGDAQAQQFRLQAFARLVERNPDKSLFAPLMKALKIADPALRVALVNILPKVNSLTEHAELVTHLRDRDPGLKQAATQALAQMGGGKTTFELLTAACDERDFAGHVKAMKVLVSFAKHQAVPTLAAALAANNQQKKVLALRHLGD